MIRPFQPISTAMIATNNTAHTQKFDSNIQKGEFITTALFNRFCKRYSIVVFSEL